MSLVGGRGRYRLANLTGRLIVDLRVRDVAASAAWYSALLNLNPVRDFHGPDGRLVHIVLAHESGLTLGLIGPPSADEDFDEYHVGLDHLEFLVATVDDLHQWATRLAELGIANSGLRTRPHGSVMVTFRDPDNIQLELYAFKASAVRK